jgi:hypothetical protein
MTDWRADRLLSGVTHTQEDGEMMISLPPVWMMMMVMMVTTTEMQFCTHFLCLC